VQASLSRNPLAPPLLPTNTIDSLSFIFLLAFLISLVVVEELTQRKQPRDSSQVEQSG